MHWSRHCDPLPRYDMSSFFFLVALHRLHLSHRGSHSQARPCRWRKSIEQAKDLKWLDAGVQYSSAVVPHSYLYKFLLTLSRLPDARRPETCLHFYLLAPRRPAGAGAVRHHLFLFGGIVLSCYRRCVLRVIEYHPEPAGTGLHARHGRLRQDAVVASGPRQ